MKVNQLNYFHFVWAHLFETISDSITFRKSAHNSLKVVYQSERWIFGYFYLKSSKKCEIARDA